MTEFRILSIKSEGNLPRLTDFKKRRNIGNKAQRSDFYCKVFQWGYRNRWQKMAAQVSVFVQFVCFRRLYV